MKMYPLTKEQKEHLIQQGCTAEYWEKIKVSPRFNTERVHHVAFYGDIELGDNNNYSENIPEEERGISHATLKNICISNNVSINHVGIISNYYIGENVRICRVNELTTNKNFQLWNEAITVGNEAGEPNIFFSPEQNEQEDWMRLHYPVLLQQNHSKAEQSNPETYTNVTVRIENGVSIINSGCIRDTIIGNRTTIDGAAELQNGFIECDSYIGTSVVAHTFRIGSHSRITEGANLHHTIVGNYCKIGKGFTAENSYICHHCELFCGEACAIFAGPHTVSHHKSSLLIGGEFSFYNAGSGTNQSNHAYKMGPIHYGTLGRGSKTASSSHILWPMQTAPFTMVMGKISCHPNLENLPFSYLIADQGKTVLVPGINIGTIGTYRDIIKWKERGRTNDTEAIDRENATYDFLSPLIMQKVFIAIEILKNLQQEYGAEKAFYSYEHCIISNSALQKGIRFYDLIIRLYLSKLDLTTYDEEECKIIGSKWIDVAGIPIPLNLVEQVMSDTTPKGKEISNKNIRNIIQDSSRKYVRLANTWGIKAMQKFYQTELPELRHIQNNCKNAIEEWKELLKKDVEKEYKLGDVSSDILEKFMTKIEGITTEIL